MRSLDVRATRLAFTVLLLTSCSQGDSPGPPGPSPTPPPAESMPTPESPSWTPVEPAERAAIVSAPILIVPGLLGSWTYPTDLIYQEADVSDLKAWKLSEDVKGGAWNVFIHFRSRLFAKGLAKDKDVFA